MKRFFFLTRCLRKKKKTSLPPSPTIGLQPDFPPNVPFPTIPFLTHALFPSIPSNPLHVSGLILPETAMSDPEPSVTTFSSSPPSSTQTSESAAALNYAFLVHSQKTLTQNLPPRVDNKLLARQKRRRTR